MNSSREELVNFAQVSKNFAGHKALHPLSFCLRAGHSLAILGPNGAGKTTMIRLLMGVIPPSGGTLRVFGEPVSTSAFQSKKKIGVVIEEQTFFLDMSAWDYLSLFGELYQISDAGERAASLLQYMELYEARFKKLKEFSTGMKKKLNIIQAALHRPEILILDEPFSGLDPQGISLTLDLLRNMKAAGTTLIISSHILSEIDGLVEDILIINAGEVRAYGSKEELWKNLGGNYVMDMVLLEDNPTALDALTSRPEVASWKAQGDRGYIFSIDGNGEESCRAMSRAVADNHILLSRFSFSLPSVKTIYEKVMAAAGENA